MIFSYNSNHYHSFGSQFTFIQLQIHILKEDEANYAKRIKDAKAAQGREEENPNAIENIFGDVKYKIDGGVNDGVEKVKIDWHDWDQIGSDLRR